ncbi:hypothetical protein RIN66_22110 (plasmid) [Hafnia alvei]|nr:hypothetical protein [Hafnia alvei]WNN54805.1 hypothetical protein RIN66_22110 [Hafnia alvei]
MSSINVTLRTVAVGAISHKRDFRRTAITVIHGRGNLPFTGNLHCVG